MNIPKQPTNPKMPDIKDRLYIFDDVHPVIIKDCKYLLPCGKCDKTGQICSQYCNNIKNE